MQQHINANIPYVWKQQAGLDLYLYDVTSAGIIMKLSLFVFTRLRILTTSACRCNRRELPVTRTYKDWSDVPLQKEGASCYPHVQRLVRRSVATGGSFLLPPRTKIGQTFRCNRRELPVTRTYKDWSDVPLQKEGASCYPHVQRLVRRSVATGGSFLLPPRTKIGQTFRCNRRELPVTPTYKDWSDVPLQKEGASCYPHVQR